MALAAALATCGCGGSERKPGAPATLGAPRVEASGPLTRVAGAVTLTATVGVDSLPPCTDAPCRFELEIDVALSQIGTAVLARHFAVVKPLTSSGTVSATVDWDGARDDATAAPAPDDVYRADAVVALVERANGHSTTLATTTTVGAAPPRFALVEVARFNACEGCGTRAVTYSRSTELVCPLVEGTDLGQPATGDSRGFPGDALIFGDAAGGVVRGSQPSPLSSFVPMLPAPSSFLDAAGNALPGNDDVLGFLSATNEPTKSAGRCDLGLDFATRGGSIAPVTMNGPYGDGRAGGTFLGALGVPGSPFFAGGRLFALMSQAEGTSPLSLLWWLSCSADSDCPGGDRCVPRPLLSADGTPNGTWSVCVARGECPNPTDPASPCFVRARPRRLGVSDPGAPEAFVSPGTAAATDPAAVASPYPPEFAITSAFVASGPPDVVYVFGRESLDGVPGTWSSAVHLLRHRVDDGGRLEPPEIFGGCRKAAAADSSAPTDVCEAGGEPVFARGARPAVLFDEEKAIVTNTRSVVLVPGLGEDRRGLYVMLYGGRRPTSFLTGPPRLAQPTLSAASIGDELSGIYVRTAPRPWGPWSAAKTVFSPFSRINDGYCRSMYYDANGPARSATFTCAPGADAENRALARNPVAPNDSGAEYGAGIIPGLVRLVRADAGPDHVVLHWLMSTWNPYGVVVMRTELATARTAAGVPSAPRTEESIAATLTALRAERRAVAASRGRDGG